MKSYLMKRHLCFFMIFLSVIVFVRPQVAYSGDFNPTRLEIIGDNLITHSYGRALELPITIIGRPAIVILSICPENLPAINIHNGYLGWHYVNNIDTCIYVSPPKQYPTGKSSIVWDGKVSSGNIDQQLLSGNCYLYR